MASSGPALGLILLEAPNEVIDQPLVADGQHGAKLIGPGVLLSAFDESPTVPFEFGDKGALVMSKMPDTSGTLIARSA